MFASGSTFTVKAVDMVSQLMTFQFQLTQDFTMNYLGREGASTPFENPPPVTFFWLERLSQYQWSLGGCDQGGATERQTLAIVLGIKSYMEWEVWAFRWKPFGDRKHFDDRIFMRSRANPVRMGGGILGQTYHKPRHLSHQFFSASFCLCSSVSSQSALQSARFCFRFCFFHFWLQKPCNNLTALHRYRHRHQSLRAFWCQMQKLRKATWYKHFSLKSFWTFIGHCLQTLVFAVFFSNAPSIAYVLTFNHLQLQKWSTKNHYLWFNVRNFCWPVIHKQTFRFNFFLLSGTICPTNGAFEISYLWLSFHCWLVFKRSIVLAVCFHCDNEMGGNPKNSKIL